jgi:hypothetical protein
MDVSPTSAVPTWPELENTNPSTMQSSSRNIAQSPLDCNAYYNPNTPSVVKSPPTVHNNISPKSSNDASQTLVPTEESWHKFKNKFEDEFLL